MPGRVLVIEANARDRELAVRCLEPAGHDVVCATEALGALAVVDRDRPSVILLDAKVRGMSVVSFIRHVRQAERIPPSHVILLSRGLATEELLAAMAAGADDYMSKPVRREALLSSIGDLERLRVWAAAALASKLGRSAGTPGSRSPSARRREPHERDCTTRLPSANVGNLAAILTAQTLWT